MAKVNNVGLNLTHKIANPFKTSRSGVTNPFKYQDFEGNTLNLDPLAFADVLSVSKAKNNKLKMITSSVAGSMTRIRSSIAEPIIALVNKVKCYINNTLDYANNTKITEFGSYKPIVDLMNTDIVEIGKGIGHKVSGIGKSISDSVSGIGKGISDRMPILNRDILDVGKDISEKWTILVNNLKPSHSIKISKDTSVDELRTMWQKEIELAGSSEEGRMVA